MPRSSPCSAPFPCHLTFGWYCPPCKERRNRSRAEGTCSYPTSNGVLPNYTPPPAAEGPVNRRRSPYSILPLRYSFGWTWNLIPPWTPAPWGPA